MIGRPKATNPNGVARVEEIIMMNHRILSIATSQAIKDDSEPLGISLTTVRKIQCDPMTKRLEEVMRNEGGHVSC
jgi:hypothetical protein